MRTERQKKLIQDLESLVHRRFNEKTLNATLSKIFEEDVKVEETKTEEAQPKKAKRPYKSRNKKQD